jgi:hypothetical protein
VNRLLVLVSTACVLVVVGVACYGGIAATRAKSYHSIAELDRDSIAVALVRGTSQRSIDSPNGVPYTVTLVTVDRVLRGQLPGTTLKIRQLGGPGVTSPDDGPVLVSGRQYAVFLTVFTYGPGRETDQYVITGAAGLYENNGTLLIRLDPQSRDLPASLTLAELEAQIKH